MKVLLGLCALWMLVRSGTAMDAASQACALFVRSVLPGLFPYMTVALLAVSRVSAPVPGWAVILLGWGGGSPTGARLISQAPGASGKRTAVCCATISPMFLVGTLGGWLQSAWAGVCLLAAVLAGGYVASLTVPAGKRNVSNPAPEPPSAPLRLGQAVETAARTMLMVCGTMVMMRVMSSLVSELLHGLPTLSLVLTTLLEVTTGTSAIAQLPLPLALRTALMAAATGFGGAAVILQNRAVYPASLISLPEQLLWQALHAGLSFLIALALMLL